MVSRIFFLLVFFGWDCAILKAQSGLWDNAKGKGLGELKEKKISAYKRWKGQLEQSGTDSSYHHAFYIGGSLNTNGWSGCIGYEKPLQRGRKAVPQSIYYELSFSEVKHEKQQKQQSGSNAYPELGKSTPFIFGKINNLYLLNIGIGRERLLLPKVIENSISVSLRYGGGFSFAILKPYYLKLAYEHNLPVKTDTLKEERYSDANASIFLDKSRILGASDWSKGLDELQLVPGVYAQGAVCIQPAKGKYFVQNILLGGVVAVYTQNLPIMAERIAFPWIMSLNVGMVLERRKK